MGRDLICVGETRKRRKWRVPETSDKKWGERDGLGRKRGKKMFEEMFVRKDGSELEKPPTKRQTTGGRKRKVDK